MKRNLSIGRKNHSRSGVWRAVAMFALALMVPLSASAQFGPTPSFGTATNFPAQTGPQSVAVANFNDNTDAFLDMAVVNSRPTASRSSWAMDSEASEPPSTSLLGVGTGPVDIAAGDLNGDGNIDIVTANGTSGNVTVLLGDGLGGFTQPAGPFAGGNHSPRASPSERSRTTRSSTSWWPIPGPITSPCSPEMEQASSPPPRTMR